MTSPLTRERRRGILAGPWSDLRRTQPNLEEFASPLFGPAPTTVDLMYDVDDVRSFHVAALSADSTEVLGYPCNGQNGGGGFDRDSARAAAIGETLERYSATYMPDSRLRFSTYEDLDAPAVLPGATALFSERQYADPDFAYRPFTGTTPVRWVEGVDLGRAEPAWVPAQFVFLNPARAEGEPRVAYATSNGLAAGPTRPEAVLNGLLELVERDALMITWHARLSLPLVELDADPQVRRLLDRYVRPTGLSVYAVDLSAFWGVPAALGVVRNEHSDVAALGLGAAAATTMSRAVGKAVTEAMQTRNWCKNRQLEMDRLPDDADPAAEITDFDDHIRLYAERDRAARADFLLSSPERLDPREVAPLPGATPGEAVDAVVEALTRGGTDVYAVDVTSPDVRDAGLSVVKTYAPRLQPLDVGWRTRWLGGPRLYEAPYRMGLRERVLTEADLNPFPHPFP